MDEKEINKNILNLLKKITQLTELSILILYDKIPNNCTEYKLSREFYIPPHLERFKFKNILILPEFNFFNQNLILRPFTFKNQLFLFHMFFSKQLLFQDEINILSELDSNFNKNKVNKSIFPSITRVDNVLSLQKALNGNIFSKRFDNIISK